MNNTALALLGYAAWTLSLILIVEMIRVYLVVAKGYKAATFKPDGSDISPFMHRLCRAHANCFENFPIIGGLLLLALATENTGITDALALYLLGARLGQSLLHVLSGRSLIINFRFVCYVIQLLISLWWVLGFIWTMST